VLDGAQVRLSNPLGFPLPPLPENVRPDAEGEWTILVDDRMPAEPATGRLLRLVPRTLAVGVGSARGVPTDAVRECLRAALARNGLDPHAVRCFATIDLKADEDGITRAVAAHAEAYGPAGALPRYYSAEALAGVPVANPSQVVLDEVGTPSVAEAAALLAAREEADSAGVSTAVEKHKGDNVTVAAVRAHPRGRLVVVGLGPGSEESRTPAATEHLRRASIVVGLDSYLDQVRHVLRPGTRTVPSGLGEEERRAAEAVKLARDGHAVALVGSGDAGCTRWAARHWSTPGTTSRSSACPG
jgi:cobalt-precorrin 5A hydrolase/precorrin-3B C17-methyltransferase